MKTSRRCQSPLLPRNDPPPKRKEQSGGRRSESQKSLKQPPVTLMAASAVTYADQPSPTQRSEEEWGEDPRLERFRKRQFNNQLEAGESDNEDEDSTFAYPDHAVENKEKEEAETVKATTTAPPVEQRAVDSAAATTTPQPTLPQTSLQKLEAAYGAALHHNNGT